MNLKTLFIVLNALNLFALCLVIVVILEYKSAFDAMEQTYISKNKSFLLADELRQSSDDLTRLARTYVITANKRFKQQYFEVLAIRNGKYPRPAHYNRIYWDFLAVDGIAEKPDLQRKSIALRTLMKKAGFTKVELALLNQSQLQSDSLVNLEERAMHAVEGYFEDDKGKYTIVGKPNMRLAREIMHSDEYHKSKVKIMNPLNKFFKLFEERTNGMIIKSKSYLNKVEILLFITVLFFIILMIVSMVAMFKRIIYPLIGLKHTMLSLANNNLNVPIPFIKYHDEVGAMIGAVNIFKENTKRLIVSERRIKLLLDSIGEGVFGLNEKEEFTFVNPAACEFLGISSTELIGSNLNQIVYKDAMHSKDQILLFEKSNEHATGVIELQRKDKTKFYAEYISTPIINKSNKIEGFVIVFSDITERRKNEKEMQTAKNNAEKANRSKSLFLANMSHELRTPLNAILGFTRLLLKETTLQRNQKESLEIIHNSGKHLLSIISEILEVSKLQAGKIEITNKSFDLHRFLENIFFIFSSRAQEKGLVFNTNNFGQLPQYIIADEQRLRQVLFNLLSNALKFTETGSVTLNVDFKKNHLNFDIIDTGLGIKDEDMHIIFKPFEQIKSEQKHYEGTGLGLAITQELIMLMGGQISVTSELTQGTKFSVKLYTLAGTNDDSLNKSFKNKTLISKDSQRYKVLIVDDIYENRLLLVHMVQSLGFLTCEAEDGLMALEQLKKHNPDIILMDIQMPKMDGYEAIKAIRSGIHKADIPIAIISAKVFEEEREKALKNGADAFVGKPIKESEIVSVMEDYLNVSFVTHSSLQPQVSCFKPDTSLISQEDIKQIIQASKELDSNQIIAILMKYEQYNLESVAFLRTKVYNYEFTEIISYANSLKAKVD